MHLRYQQFHITYLAPTKYILRIFTYLHDIFRNKGKLLGCCVLVPNLASASLPHFLVVPAKSREHSITYLKKIVQVSYHLDPPYALPRRLA